MNAPSSDALQLSFLREKIGLLDRYLTLTEALRECLFRRDLNGIEKLISERSGLIERIDLLDQKIRRVGFEVQGRDLTSVENEISTICQRINSMDRESVEILGSWKEDVKRELLETRALRAGIHGYHQAYKSKPKFLDVTR